MQTLAVLSHKGGTGKTTVAAGLAVAAYAAGRRTVLVDMDGQRSAAAWAKLRPVPGPQIQEARAGTFYFVRQAAERLRTDMMVVDTPAHVDADSLEAVRWADLCLVVVRPSFFDIEAVGRTVEAARALRRPAVFLLNQGPTTGGGPIVESALAALERYGAPVLKTRLPFRPLHQTAAAKGLTALDSEEGGQAAAEIEALWAELQGRLSGATTPEIRAATA